MKKRRLLSIVLSLCMVLSLMPQMVFAETLKYGDFEYSVSDDKVTITGYTGSGDVVVIPDSINGYPVTAIGSNAFYMNYYIENVTIPDSITSIGDHAFYGCPLIRSVVLPGSVTSVENWAFDQCNSLYGVFISSKSTINYERYSFPEHASIVKYMLNPLTHEAYITDIALGYYMGAANIPEEICGYPVTEVVPEHRDKVGGHKCAGEGATCMVPQVCRICGNTFNPHSFTQENKNLTGALKTAGDCTTEATYYYSCVHCNSIEGDDNHTFKGDKDSSKHTGSLVWQTTETQHKQYWNCCNAVAVDYEGHAWSDGKCSICDYICTHSDASPKDHLCDICGKTVSEHTGGTATCIRKAVCEHCGEEYGELDRSNHDPEKIPAKEATVTETGNKEYWHCLDCGKYFADENGTNEITLDDTVISKLPPEIIKGKSQSITAGEKKALTFTSNAAFSDFIRVELDGKTLDEKNYTVKEGSTIVTLKAEYVATLPAGKHTIGIVSESGTAINTFTVAEIAAAEDSAKTGDSTNLALWLALMILSGAGITGTTIYTRRKRTNE